MHQQGRNAVMSPLIPMSTGDVDDSLRILEGGV
jgi:hypothetical protein